MVDSSTQQRLAMIQRREIADDDAESAFLDPSDGSGQKSYDRRALTYANTFENVWKANIIRALEWMTGKVRIILMLREFKNRPKTRSTMWRHALDVMGIKILTPPEQIARIPQTGPVIFVANHPHGLVDGMVIAELIVNVRSDFKILTRGILTHIDEVAASYMISVPFPHEQDSQRKGIEMRTATMKTLAEGGAIALFPSGVVASSDTMFGPAIEREWNVFTAKMIRRSGAQVVPLFFPGSNSRWYQIANRISATLRQGLLLHEIVAACRKPQSPVVGKPIPAEEIAARIEDPREFMTWLREHTLSLKDNPDKF